ncbi:MAG: hypothetical protein IJE07_14530 [Clostridia bacterium]|nr:hypothetical protein [Clostridia bacterium]
MDFKNITFYPDFWIDAVVFVVIALGLILLSKCVWEWREKRRLQKEFAAYQQRREDEDQAG